MSLFKKTSLILLNLISLSIFVFVVYDLQNIFGFHYYLRSINKFSWINYYLPQYLFVAAALLSVIVVVTILVIVVSPRLYTVILAKKDKGILNINRSSIEGFVREVVVNNDYMKNSKITVAISKNKIKIQIKGEIIPRVQIVEKTEMIKKEVTDGLLSFFGLNHKISLKVFVTSINNENNNTNSRVM